MNEPFDRTETDVDDIGPMGNRLTRRTESAADGAATLIKMNRLVSKNYKLLALLTEWQERFGGDMYEDESLNKRTRETLK